MSLASQQAGRDAEDFDNDRKDGRYSPGGDRSGWFMPLDAEPAKSLRTTPLKDMGK